MKQKQLDATTIKLLAILAMTIDHVTWLCCPGYPVEALPIILHLIGRITCPIMCYFVAEGYHYTKNIRRYTARMFLFAILSHFAYVFASAEFSGWRSFLPFSDGRILNQTSVMWSLAWGLVMLRIANSEKFTQAGKVALTLLICLITLPSDWSCIASLCILAFGTNRGSFSRQMAWMLGYVALYAAVYFFAISEVYGLLQMGVVLAIPVLRRYNGQRGRDPRFHRVMKWLFYWYYPLHLFVLGWIQAAG